MHELHAPAHCAGSLSSVGSFCLHFDISAPLVIFRYSNASESSAESAGAWKLESTCLTSPAQPRYPLPAFSQDIAEVATHIAQIPALSKSRDSGLGCVCSCSLVCSCCFWINPRASAFLGCCLADSFNAPAVRSQKKKRDRETETGNPAYSTKLAKCP